MVAYSHSCRVWRAWRAHNGGRAWTQSNLQINVFGSVPYDIMIYTQYTRPRHGLLQHTCSVVRACERWCACVRVLVCICVNIVMRADSMPTVVNCHIINQVSVAPCIVCNRLCLLLSIQWNTRTTAMHAGLRVFQWYWCAWPSILFLARLSALDSICVCVFHKRHDTIDKRDLRQMCVWLCSAWACVYSVVVRECMGPVCCQIAI